MSKNINTIIVEGHLARDPEITYTTSGVGISKFSIANNRDYKDKNNQEIKVVNFFDIETWGNQADNCQKFLKKGSHVLVEGELVQDKWVDQQTGQNKTKLKVKASFVNFLSSPNQQGQQVPPQGQYQQQVPQQGYNQQYQQQRTPQQPMQQPMQQNYIQDPWAEQQYNS